VTDAIETGSVPHTTGLRAADVRIGALIVAVFGGVGLLAGLAWWLLAPRVQIRIVTGGAEFVDPSPPQFIEADLWFGAICVLAGVAAGIGVWLWVRDRPTTVVVGIAIGSVLGSLIAWRVGLFLGRVDLTTALKQPVGTVLDGPLGLRSKGMLVALPVGALAAWLVTDLIASDRPRQLETPPAQTAIWYGYDPGAHAPGHPASWAPPAPGPPPGGGAPGWPPVQGPPPGQGPPWESPPRPGGSVG